jgi:hypothetical protein
MSYSFSSLEAALAITLVDPDRYASLLQPFHCTVRYLSYRTHNKCLLQVFNGVLSFLPCAVSLSTRRELTSSELPSSTSSAEEPDALTDLDLTAEGSHLVKVRERERERES